MRTIYVLTALLVFISVLSYGQNSVDVLRYSQSYNNGSARFNAMGGSFGALGGDFSSISINPAGIGIYKTSEFIFTPSVYFSKSNTMTNNNSGIGRKNNFNLNNVGLVATTRINRENGWRGFQFGIGLNRSNNFNREANILNHNNSGSLITDYQTQAYGSYPNQLDAFSTDLAWKSYLLEDTVRVNGGVLAYTSPLADGGTKQVERVLQWGSVNEMLFAMGGSYEDKFYIGGAIGFPFSRYFEQVRHAEYDELDTIASFDSFVMNRYLETKGTGVNFRLGVIVRPISMLRFGFSFQSPTWFSMSDYYYSDMEQFYDGGVNSGVQSSPNGSFDYYLTTPMKINGSVALVVGKFMLFNFDAEYLDYSEGYLNSDAYAFFNENEEVRLKYTSALNLRAGMEMRFNPVAVRLGFASFGNPYDNNINDASRIQFSGGIGFRDENMFFDLAYVYAIQSEDYYMYDPLFTPASNIENKMHQISASLGFKF
jgi:hypothetical protein